MAVVAAGKLVKIYKGGRRALDGLDLRIEEGEIFGLLGPNGAGKTTFVKCVLDLLRPTSGSVTVFGKPANNARSRSRVGFAPELPRFPDFLSGPEIMHLHAALAGIPRERAAAQVEALLKQAELEEAPRRVKAYSKGMVRRLAVAQAYLGDPDLLILDEPTADLDPIGRRAVRNQLLAAKERGASVLLNSHLLSEVERVCDRVLIIHRGAVLAEGSLDDLVPEGTDLETVFVDLIEGAE
ncbi:MAG: ABC transporter ATP-binding protein [Actinomycetota bacterium]